MGEGVTVALRLLPVVSLALVVLAAEGPAREAGGMYVWEIRFRATESRLTVSVTIQQDADRDGVAEFYDDPLPDAAVDFTLRRDTDGDGAFDCGSDECRSFSGTTGIDGEVEFAWEPARPGGYEAEVTALTHAAFAWDRGIDADTRAYVTVP